MTRVNPLHHDGLTADTVNTKDKIVSYVPGVKGSSRRYTVLNTPYVDDDGDLVVDLLTEEKRELTALTSEVGLSGGRQDGVWTHVAVIDEE